MRPYPRGSPRRYRDPVSLPRDVAEPPTADTGTPRYQARIELAGTRAAVIAFVLAAVLGTVLMWGQRHPLAGDASLGIIEGDLARIFVAAMETAIGLSLLTGRYLRVGMALLGIAMVGVLSPLALFPADLFAGNYNAPTLAGQYVIKDIVLLTAALVVVLRQRGAELVIVPEDGAEPGERGR